MALTDPQKATLLEIVGLSELVELEYLLGYISSAQETRIAADIATYDSIKDKHLRVRGGKDGIDLDDERKRAGVRERCMIHLRMNSGGGATMMVRA